MAWSKPIAREIKCGMEINMYGPGEDWFDEDAYALPQIEKTDW